MDRLAVVVATGALAAMVGCGGANDAPQSGDQAISATADAGAIAVDPRTKRKFIARVNNLCRRHWRFVLNAVRLTRVLWKRQHPRVSTSRNFARAVRLSYFASINFLIFDEIRRFVVPPGEGRAVKKLTGLMQKLIERGAQHWSVASTAKLQAMFAGYNRLAGQYGLSECLVAGSHLPHPET
jgi:hypothetical protein